MSNTPTRWLKTSPMIWELWQSGSLPAATLESDHAEITEDARAAVELLSHLVVCAGVLDSTIEAESCPVLLRDLAQAARRSFQAWVPIPVSLEQRPALADITPAALDILRAELRDAILGQEAAERQLALAQADANHLRVTLVSLLDRARNWVQDPELRAEITKHCPPTPRTEADHG
jgi:hypothetical protein